MSNAPSIWDRFVSITTYFTFGTTGVIWLIASYLIFKKPMSPFVAYHVYQSIFISILLYVIGMFLSIAFNLTANIPLIGGVVKFLNLYLFNLPIFYTFSLVHFIIFIIIVYLSLGALLGKLSYFPFISDVIRSNFRN